MRNGNVRHTHTACHIAKVIIALLMLGAMGLMGCGKRARDLLPGGKTVKVSIIYGSEKEA
jgi:hypothetical protein